MDNRFKRKDDENLKQYKKRLCENKNIYKLNWEDVTELINKESGENFSSTTYRKWWYSYSEGYRDAINKGNKIDNINNKNTLNKALNELELKRIEMEKEKIRFQDQKREYRNLIRLEARWEHLKNEIVKSISDLNTHQPLINCCKKEYKNINGSVEASLQLSDWHIGLEVNNNFNQFNVEIAKQRVSKLTQKVKKYCILNNVKVLHIELLGDIVNGIIHVTTRINNEEDVINQTMIASELISEMINELATTIEIINVYCTTGNHARVNANIKDNIEPENFERLIPWYLKARVKCKNVYFKENEFDNELIAYKINGEYIFGLHGHHDKPNKVIDNWSKMLKIFPKEVHLGHWHKHNENEEYDILVSINGCLSGVDQFAKQIRKTNSPFQRLTIYRKGEDESFTYRIKLN